MLAATVLSGSADSDMAKLALDYCRTFEDISADEPGAEELKEAACLVFLDGENMAEELAKVRKGILERHEAAERKRAKEAAAEDTARAVAEAARKEAAEKAKTVAQQTQQPQQPTNQATPITVLFHSASLLHN